MNCKSAGWLPEYNECELYEDARSDFPDDDDSYWFYDEDYINYIYDITGCTTAPGQSTTASPASTAAPAATTTAKPVPTTTKAPVPGTCGIIQGTRLSQNILQGKVKTELTCGAVSARLPMI